MLQGLKEYASILLLILTALLAACVQDDNRLGELLDVEKPFGFHWSDSREMPKYLVEYCQNRVDSIKVILTEKEVSTIEEVCISEQLNIVFLDSSEIPLDLQQGSIRINVLGKHKPLTYSYSYMYELDPTPKTRKMKEVHAAKFKRKIIDLYGNPISSGFFNEGSQTGFVVTDEYPNTCDFWIAGNFGILLCSERIVFLDGFEMSLSIIRLDNTEYGRKLKKYILKNSGADSLPQKPELNPIHLDEAVSVTDALEILTNSVGGRLCNAESLKPLDQAWDVSKDNQKKLQDFLGLHRGDKLAEFIFEKSDDLEIMFPEINQDKLMLYLFKQAAIQGSAAAMNEIGASLFYCYQGVIKNTSEARKWFDRAMEAGDLYAVKSKAFLELQDKENFPNSRSQGLQLLRECAESNPDLCEADLSAILTLINLERETD